MAEPPIINELAPPPMATECGAVEVLRVWARSNSPQQVALLTTWSDPSAWGILLADVARHVARAYAEQGTPEMEALERVVALFRAELASPTDELTRL